jgi:hypothetical protein
LLVGAGVCGAQPTNSLLLFSFVSWSTTITGRFHETEAVGDDVWDHRIVCTAVKDFESSNPDHYARPQD